MTALTCCGHVSTSVSVFISSNVSGYVQVSLEKGWAFKPEGLCSVLTKCHCSGLVDFLMWLSYKYIKSSVYVVAVSQNNPSVCVECDFVEVCPVHLELSLHFSSTMECGGCGASFVQQCDGFLPCLLL